jgi:hypothetical protein
MSPTAPEMKAPESGVTVRMYNTGFGDCLLLAFRADDDADNARYVLIDFGVHHQYPDREKQVKLVAKDIAKATGGHLHVVAATHEHTDHLYGFKYARDAFDGIRIDQLWLAWTEDPDDETAHQLKERYGMRMRALGAAIGQLRKSRPLSADALQRVLDFEYPGALGASEGGKAAQLEYLKRKSKKKLEKSEDYKHPGDTFFGIPDVSDVRVYVLGPPTEVEWIRNLERAKELYPEHAAMHAFDAFAIAALAAAEEGRLSESEEKLFSWTRPFDDTLAVSPKKAKDGEFFKTRYGFSGRLGHGPEWRRIDTDWLASAEQLALDIESKTNNTSLVLAFELTKSEHRKVLLFAADAQVGNWLSWHEWLWLGEGDDDPDVTAEDLLNRTVLYKVGHHGSRNATLSTKGLEMMESGELVAMVPVDAEWALSVMGWEHPADTLLKTLTKKSHGRIIRTDEIPTGEDAPSRPSEAGANEWKEFLKNLDWDRSGNQLWIQYTVTE